jgi:hypothetical protein
MSIFKKQKLMKEVSGFLHMKRRGQNWKCNHQCINHKLCARYDCRGGNHKAYCLPDFLRYGFIEKVK